MISKYDGGEKPFHDSKKSNKSLGVRQPRSVQNLHYEKLETSWTHKSGHVRRKSAASPPAWLSLSSASHACLPWGLGQLCDNRMWQEGRLSFRQDGTGSLASCLCTTSLRSHKSSELAQLLRERPEATWRRGPHRSSPPAGGEAAPGLAGRLGDLIEQSRAQPTTP